MHLGKTQVMGEIKIALKKEMKTEGEHLVLEILQCRNITYKFKTPDHLPGNWKYLIYAHDRTNAKLKYTNWASCCDISLIVIHSVKNGVLGRGRWKRGKSIFTESFHDTHNLYRI